MTAEPVDLNLTGDGELLRAPCGCGVEVVLTPEGWQHDAAPWFWGDDHDAWPNLPEGEIRAWLAVQTGEEWDSMKEAEEGL